MLILKDDLNIYGKKVYRYSYDLIHSNMYLMIEQESAVMIDCVESEEALQQMQDCGVKKIWIFITHEHYDHIQGINYYREHFDCTVMGNAIALEAIQNPKKNLAAYLESLLLFRDYPENWREVYNMPEDYSCVGDRILADREVFQWEEINFTYVYTPGHSKGSACIVIGKDYVFTGDTLILNEDIILRLPGGSKKDYNNKTLSFLESICETAVIFPGHGESGTKEEFRVSEGDRRG